MAPDVRLMVLGRKNGKIWRRRWHQHHHQQGLTRLNFDCTPNCLATIIWIDGSWLEQVTTPDTPRRVDAPRYVPLYPLAIRIVIPIFLCLRYLFCSLSFLRFQCVKMPRLLQYGYLWNSNFLRKHHVCFHCHQSNILWSVINYVEVKRQQTEGVCEASVQRSHRI